jgi:geranylgeranyl diphosphate synthase, type I
VAATDPSLRVVPQVAPSGNVPGAVRAETALPAGGPELPSAPPHSYLSPRRSVAAVEALMLKLAGGGGADAAGLAAAEHLRTGGKRLRARLALASTEALGVAAEDGLGWAAACELLHNATLIHDDVMDGDRTRRGQPTVWARHGVEQAITSGDLMLILPYLALEHVAGSDGVRWRLTRSLAACASAVARGQAAELQIRARTGTSWKAYRNAVIGKTGALFQLPVEGAALLAGRTAAEASWVSGPFQHLGVAFQLQDDILDLYGDKGREAPGADLREGKVSVLVLEHLARVPGDRAWLEELLGTPRAHTAEEGVQAAIQRFRESGALRGALRRIEAELAEVRRSPWLRREPALRMLALQLAKEALRPIRHLGHERRAGARVVPLRGASAQPVSGTT